MVNLMLFLLGNLSLKFFGSLEKTSEFLHPIPDLFDQVPHPFLELCPDAFEHFQDGLTGLLDTISHSTFH